MELGLNTKFALHIECELKHAPYANVTSLKHKTKTKTQNWDSMLSVKLGLKHSPVATPQV